MSELVCTASEWNRVDDHLPEKPASPWNGDRWMLLAWESEYEWRWHIQVETEMGGYNIICNPHEDDRDPGPVAWRYVRPPAQPAPQPQEGEAE